VTVCTLLNLCGLIEEMTTLREFAEDLRTSANITDIISSYIPLKKSGSTYKALCPFHKEKTPSFHVSPGRQIFHCFGCGVGGDVIKFIMMFEKVSFREAIEILAKRLGKPLPTFQTQSFDKEKAQYRNVLLEIHERASKFFTQLLFEKRIGRAARDYLEKRGISSESIEAFGVGYAAAGDKGFLDVARRAGYSEKALQDAGLIIKRTGEEGYYERFRQRLIFPIRDHLGRCVGFGGRGLTDEVTPKYLNSPETLIYNKSSVLYGLDRAKHEIGRQEFTIIAEGYFDVIVLHQFGFTNSVATLGTALTDQQARLIQRFCKKVIFLYDGDEAGEKAMLRGAEVLFRNHLQIKVALLPDNEDPDSFLNTRGADALHNLLEKESVDLVEFFLKTVSKHYDLNKPEGKVAVLDLFVPLLTEIDNVIYYNQYVKILSETLGLDEQLVNQYLKKEGRKIRSSKSGHGDSSNDLVQQIVDASQSQAVLMEMALLRILLDCPHSRQLLHQRIDCAWVRDQQIRRWVERLLDAQNLEELTLPHLLEECEDDKAACVLRQAALWQHLSGEYDAHLREIPRRLQCRHEKLQRKKLIAHINEYYQLKKEYASTRELLAETHKTSQKLHNIARGK